MDHAAAGYELTATEVADALGDLVTAATVRNWYHAGRLPESYVWRSPTGRLLFKHKAIAWILSMGALPQAPKPPRPAPPPVRPVRWDRAS